MFDANILILVFNKKDIIKIWLQPESKFIVKRETCHVQQVNYNYLVDFATITNHTIICGAETGIEVWILLPEQGGLLDS